MASSLAGVVGAAPRLDGDVSQPGVEPGAIDMPAVAVQIVQEVCLAWRGMSPDRAIAQAWQMAFCHELIEQAHVRQQPLCSWR